MGKVILTKKEGTSHLFTFFLTDEKVTRFQVENIDEASILGHIYVGKVQNIVASIGAAFVQISNQCNCYLPLDDCQHPIYVKKTNKNAPLQQGDELLVQVSKEALKSKEYSVTTKLQLTGKYCVLTSQDFKIGVSTKLPKDKKKRLRSLVEEYRRSEYGYIIRTSASEASPSTLYDEIQLLHEEMDHLIKYAPHQTCFTCVKKQKPTWLRRLSDLDFSQIESVITDSQQIFDEITNDKTINFQTKDQLQRYIDSYSLWKLHSLDKVVLHALKKKVWLPCGGYLVIEHTEALWVIDVNSGKSILGKNKETNVLKVNLEAVGEIARQLINRNITGICIIDFINMEDEESRKKLVQELKAAIRFDPCGAKFVDFTALHLVELTRTKKDHPLYELLDKDYDLFL